MTYTKTFRAAFPHTIPVMTGYLFMGAAFGILLQSKGYGPLWAGLMGVVIYAGSMQFVAVELLSGVFNLAGAAFMTLMVNARHIFYGFSMLEKYRGAGAKKPYLIHALTDETFTLLCGTQPPEGADPGRFYLCVSLLNHLYWVAGSVAGAVLGSAFAMDTRGIDFVMTALFVSIFTEQFRQVQGRIPALIGLGGTLLCRVVFGPGAFLLPSMVLLVAMLTAFRGRIEEGVA